MGINSKKLLTGVGIMALGVTAAGAMSHAATRELVKIAIDREYPQKITPINRKRFTGGWEDPRFVQAAERAARRLALRQMQSVEIHARDGETLAGHWYPCEGARRVILAMHGWRSSWDHDFGMVADFLHENGCSILFAEQRGQGGSGGACMGLGALERYDCADWAAWLNKKEPALPMYLAGVSMGATTVLLAAGLPLPDTVRGIVADCGFTSPQDIGRHVVENNLHMSFSLRARAADAMCRKKNREGIRSCSTVEVLQSAKIPVLLIHGADDTFVPVSMTYENYKACAAPKELLVVPGADHGMSYFVDRKRYEDALKAFWQKYD